MIDAEMKQRILKQLRLISGSRLYCQHSAENACAECMRGIKGDVGWILGNVSWIEGNVSGIRGDVSDIVKILREQDEQKVNK